jgi:hypothetical protein
VAHTLLGSNSGTASSLLKPVVAREGSDIVGEVGDVTAAMVDRSAGWTLMYRCEDCLGVETKQGVDYS